MSARGTVARGPLVSALTVTLALLLAVALAGCGGSGREEGFTVSGHVEATDVRLSAKVGGRVVEFTPVEGDRLEEGQVMARIDTTDTELALAAARAERDAAAADLLLKRTGARPEDIREAEAQVATVEAELTGAERDLSRFQELLDSGSGTAKARDDALARRDALRARRVAAREALARLRAGFRSEEKAAAEARVAAAEARIAQLEQQRRDALIVAPVAGVITEKIAEVGELLAPGAPVAVLTALQDAWLTVFIGGPDLTRVRIGQPVEVVTDGGARRTGRVTFVASRAEFTPRNVQTRDERVKLVYKLKVAVPNEDGLFKPGMPAEATFTEGAAAAAVESSGGRADDPPADAPSQAAR